MQDANAEHLLSRAELYLCLSRAFLTPGDEAAFRGLREALADDLAAIAEACGLEVAGELAAYREAIAAFPGQEALLQAYSGLFLAPPRTVQINVGAYLDGSVGGGTVSAIEAEYRRHGVERGEDFHDLADHVAVQLEFVAYLYMTAAERAASEAGDEDGGPDPEHDARRFLFDYVGRWAPRFIQDVEQGGIKREIPANPYLALARIIERAALADGLQPEVSPADMRARRAISKARQDRAERGVTAADMEVIARKLREKGLSTDHLAIAPEDRDAAQGYEKKVPPSPRRGM